MKLNFAKGYTRWTKFSFGGACDLKGRHKPNPEHTTARTQARRLADVIALYSLLGLTSRSAKFVLNYATVVEPLQALLHDNSSFLGHLFPSLVFNQFKSWTVRN